MRRKDPVPEIPPIPVRRDGAGARGTRPSPKCILQRPQAEQSAQADLLEAFWGGHDDSGLPPETHAANAGQPESAGTRNQRRKSAAARSTQRSTTMS